VGECDAVWLPFSATVLSADAAIAAVVGAVMAMIEYDYARGRLRQMPGKAVEIHFLHGRAAVGHDRVGGTTLPLTQ
jgi:hypothetical protein